MFRHILNFKLLNMKNSTSLITIIAGTATGAALGLLFAPRKGTKTRREISRKSSDYARGVRDGVMDILSDLGDDIMRARKKAMHKIEDTSTHLVKNIKEKVV